MCNLPMGALVVATGGLLPLMIVAAAWGLTGSASLRILFCKGKVHKARALCWFLLQFIQGCFPIMYYNTGHVEKSLTGLWNVKLYWRHQTVLNFNQTFGDACCLNSDHFVWLCKKRNKPVESTMTATFSTNLCGWTIVAVLWAAAAAREGPFVWHDRQSGHVLFGVKGWNIVFKQTQSQKPSIGNSPV